MLREDEPGAVGLVGPVQGAGEEVLEELGAQRGDGEFCVVEGGAARGFAGGAGSDDERPLRAKVVHEVARGAAELGLVCVEGGEERIEFVVHLRIFAVAENDRALGEYLLGLRVFFAVGGVDGSLDAADGFHDGVAVVVLRAGAGFLDAELHRLGAQFGVERGEECRGGGDLGAKEAAFVVGDHLGEVGDAEGLKFGFGDLPVVEWVDEETLKVDHGCVCVGLGTDASDVWRAAGVRIGSARSGDAPAFLANGNRKVSGPL